MLLSCVNLSKVDPLHTGSMSYPKGATHMSDTVVHIGDLNKADVLAALYNAAQPQGMGFMQYDPTPMTHNEAQAILNSGQTYFDYLKGRVMKVNLEGEEFDPWGFNRDNGTMAAETVIARLRNDGDANPAETQEDHKARVKATASQAFDSMGRSSHMSNVGGIPTMELGLADVAEELGPKVAAALDSTDA